MAFSQRENQIPAVACGVDQSRVAQTIEVVSEPGLWPQRFKRAAAKGFLCKLQHNPTPCGITQGVKDDCMTYSISTGASSFSVWQPQRPWVACLPMPTSLEQPRYLQQTCAGRTLFRYVPATVWCCQVTHKAIPLLQQFFPFMVYDKADSVGTSSSVTRPSRASEIARYDLRGHGDSDKPATPEAYANLDRWPTTWPL